MPLQRQGTGGPVHTDQLAVMQQLQLVTPQLAFHSLERNGLLLILVAVYQLKQACSRRHSHTAMASVDLVQGRKACFVLLQLLFSCQIKLQLPCHQNAALLQTKHGVINSTALLLQCRNRLQFVLYAPAPACKITLACPYTPHRACSFAVACLSEVAVLCLNDWWCGNLKPLWGLPSSLVARRTVGVWAFCVFRVFRTSCVTDNA